MNNIDSRTHVRGESVYVDDILPMKNTLHAIVPVLSRYSLIVLK